MAAVCCLCSGDLSTGQAKKKRKKLYGSTCELSRRELSRRVLSNLIDSKFSVKLKIAETSQQNSYLCRQCDTNLHKIHDLEQLMKLKGELNSLLPFLHHLPSDESGDVTAGTKRKTTTVSACSSTPKRPCIQLDPGIEDQSSSASTSSVMQQSPDVTISKYNFMCIHQHYIL